MNTDTSTDSVQDNPFLETIKRTRTEGPSNLTPIVEPGELLPANSDNAAVIPIDSSGAKHRGNRANLLPPWQPGQSGNPKGRRKKEDTITSLVQEILEETDTKTGKTHQRLIAEAMVRLALKDSQVLKELLNRCEGKVTDTIDMRTEAVNILYEMVQPEGSPRGVQPEQSRGVNPEQSRRVKPAKDTQQDDRTGQ